MGENRQGDGKQKYTEHLAKKLLFFFFLFLLCAIKKSHLLPEKNPCIIPSSDLIYAGLLLEL